MSAENFDRSQDSAGQNRLKAGMNVAGAWPSLAFLAGVEATAMRPALTISLADNKVGREPLASFGLSAGIRFSR